MDGRRGEKNSDRKRPWRIMDTVLIIVIVVSGVLAAGSFLDGILDRQREEKIRKTALQQADTPPDALSDKMTERSDIMAEPETAEETARESYQSPIDFESLRKTNPDIVAWVEIPGAGISYPVVQAADNDTYLRRDFEGKESRAGTIFLDCDSDADMMGMHSVLYGHHMRNQTMFSQIVKFKDAEFFTENREVILYTPDRELHLRTIAAVYGNADGEKRRTKFSSQEMLSRYADEMTKNCKFRELPDGGMEGLYSFVTCSYEFEDARTILYAVRETTEECKKIK